MLYYILGLYLVLINIVSLIVCVYDKYKATQGGWRVPEKTLFLLCFLGGSPFMYITMKTIRHKTLHRRFMIGIPLIIIFQALLVFFLYYHFK